MKFWAEDKEIICNSYELTESFNNYVSELRLETGTLIGADVKVTDDKGSNPLNFGIASIKINNQSSYSYVLYPKKYFEVINEIYSPVNGEFTTEQLLNNYGIELSSRYKTKSVYWCLPQMKYLNMFRELRDRTVVDNGGGALFTMVSGGSILLVDLKSAYHYNDYKTLNAQLVDFKVDSSWYANTPSDVVIVTSDLEGTIEEVVSNQPSVAKASIQQVIFNPKSRDQVFDEVNNKFNRVLHSSIVRTYEDSNFNNYPLLGETIRAYESKANEVIYTIKVTGNSNMNKVVITTVSKL